MKLRAPGKVAVLIPLFLLLGIPILNAQWLWDNDLAVATDTSHGFQAKLTFQNHGKAPLTLTRVEFSCPCVTFRFTSTTAQPGKDGTLTIILQDSKPGLVDLEGLAVGSDGSKPHEFTLRLPEPGR
jgi:hypothetical protein